MISQTDVRTFYELQPIIPLSQWWHFSVFAASILVILVFAIRMCIRDSRDLPRGLTVLLSSLRVIALVCILLYVLNPGKRSETRIVKKSRLAVLIDTSLSMGLRDRQPSATGEVTVDGPRRIDEIIKWMSTSSEIESLRKDHNVTIYRFGDQSQPEIITALPKTGSASVATPQSLIDRSRDQIRSSLRASRQRGWCAMAMFSIVFIVAIGWIAGLVSGRSPDIQAALLCVGLLGLVVGLVGLASSDLETPQFDLWTSLGWKSANLDEVPNVEKTSTEDKASQVDAETEIDWKSELAPRGTSTQLGSAIQHIVNQERGGPIAGVVILTDGRNNAGVQPSRSIAAAANAGIPIFPIGIGSIETPKNILVADIQAPPKVFPSDKFQVNGIVKAFGFAGKTVRVTLASVDEKAEEAETVEDELMIRLLGDGQATPVKFDVSRLEQGKRRYIIRAESVDGELDPRDNERAALVEIVERKTKVLLIAGGPNREFRFLRNQLHRDNDVLLHVWLQSAKPGADQESDELLFEFPQSREGVFFYDCIIAFDPDWRVFSQQQSELLERWVAEQAGGLIVVAGPVNTPEWTRRPRGDEAIDKIRGLYPVSFYSQGTAQLKLGRFGGGQAFPLGFSREGRAAQFLWLGDSASDSQLNWERFEGVFGYYAVNEPKPGADVLANFADPATSVNERLPIYLASHFYGAGRVFFQASGEMWRIRRLDVEFFQQYYVKLIRWVSQGRLLRDSTRGVLLTDRERCWMGDQVAVQAILRDPQDNPLLAESVLATVIRPDGTTQEVKLEATMNAVRPGTFSGQFTVTNEGEYRVNLPIPASPDLEVLSTYVRANIPELEKQQPERNDALLSELATKTRGHFYIGTNSFRSDESDPFSPMRLIQPQDQETYLTGTMDRFFQRKVMMWLLGLMTAALAIEWTVRRLHKLA